MALLLLGGAFSTFAAGVRIEGVRTTAYTSGASHNGAYPSSNALGTPLKSGAVKSAAADWSSWPVGTRFRVVETGQEYVVDDTGRAMVGSNTIDLYKPSSREVQRWGVRKVTIEVIEWGSPEKSIKILQDRQRARHNRIMLQKLLAQQAS